MLGARRVARARGLAVAIFRTAGDQVFALLDRCPHRGGPLSQGIVFGDSVACPLHNWTIGLADGCARHRTRAARRVSRSRAAGRRGPARRPGTGDAALHDHLPPVAPGNRPVAVPARSVLGTTMSGDVISGANMSSASETRSTCPYCGVGCGVIIESRDGPDYRRARRPGAPGELRAPVHQRQYPAPDRTAPVTRMTRLLQPRAPARRDAPAVPLSWDAALDEAAARFAGDRSQRTVRTPSASMCRGNCSPRTTTSSTSWPRGLIGTNNIDTNSRLCMSSAVAGYKQHARCRRAAGLLRGHRSCQT